MQGLSTKHQNLFVILKFKQIMSYIVGQIVLPLQGFKASWMGLQQACVASSDVLLNLTVKLGVWHLFSWIHGDFPIAQKHLCGRFQDVFELAEYVCIAS